VRLTDLFSGAAHRMKNVPGTMRRLKFWILLGVFLLILMVLRPWVDFVLGAIKDMWTLVLIPILDNPVGRFLFVNALILLTLWIVYRRFRARGRRLLGSWALDRFLSGLLHLSSGRYRRAARAFEGVLRVGRWVNLRDAAPVYPDILVDARIKLSLCYQELGDVERAMKCLELLKVRDLSPARKRDHAEAKAFVYAMSNELMEETVDREITDALEKDGGNRRLLRLRRDRSERLGELPAAIEAQRKLLRVVGRSERPKERSRLAGLHARNALRMDQEGRLEETIAEISRSRSLDSTLVVPNLIAGDLALRNGDQRAAVLEWARTPSLPALQRIRELLRKGGLRDHGDLEFLVEQFPRAGLLLVLAEQYLKTGDLQRARNCIEKHDEVGDPNRHSTHLLAAVLREEGDGPAAERLEWRALKGFLGADASPDKIGSDGPLG